MTTEQQQILLESGMDTSKMEEDGDRRYSLDGATPLEKANSNHLLVLSVILIAARKEVKYPTVQMVGHLVDTILNNEISSTTGPAEVASHSLAAILNKCTDEEELTASFKVISEKLVPAAAKKTATYALQWAARSLLMRGDAKRGNELCKVLLDLLGSASEADGKFIANQFGQIPQKPEETLISRNYATSRLLWDQRVFVMYLPQLISSQQTASGAASLNAFCCLSCMIQHVKPSMLMNHITQLQSIFIKQLQQHMQHISQNTDAASLQTSKVYLESILSTLVTVFELDNEVMESIFLQVYPDLLRLTTFKPSMAVRKSCVEIFDKMAEIESPNVRKCRSEVIDGLHDVLDDHKRAVRIKAIQARNKWYQV
eukprot:TRINITY_DN59874_c0_g1_i1.p2 TRINITY_DN59874_c0_g1~~TRINITY_DN59874_c0_g1_i1.p2  ORF type:complete len:371 (+),score=58.03 TRINITY_DN59874_c0_g1_i1:89-1201(+)